MADAMDLILNVLSLLLIALGLGFFITGTLGVLRFSTPLNRLHAVTKADNLGLGLIVAGLILQAGSLALVLKYLIIWSLMLLSAASVGHLIGQRAYQQTRQTESEGDA